MRLSLPVFLMITFTACSVEQHPPQGRYVNPSTGKTVTRDPTSNRFVDQSGNEVSYYTDTKTRDTFDNETGRKMNGLMMYDEELGGWRQVAPEERR